jgi:hypothetical protein
MEFTQGFGTTMSLRRALVVLAAAALLVASGAQAQVSSCDRLSDLAPGASEMSLCFLFFFLFQNLITV